MLSLIFEGQSLLVIFSPSFVFMKIKLKVLIQMFVAHIDLSFFKGHNLRLSAKIMAMIKYVDTATNLHGNIMIQ